MVVVSVASIPSDFLDITAARIAVRHTAVATTGGKLPFGLGGEAEVQARQLAQPGDEFLAFVPRHILDGALWIDEIAGIIAHDRCPQFLRHLGLTDAVA